MVRYTDINQIGTNIMNEPTFILGTKPHKDSIKLDLEELQAMPEEDVFAIFSDYKKRGYWFSLSNNSVLASL
jgi:hypothetical protein